MQRIFRYELPTGRGEHTIDMPFEHDPEILTCQLKATSMTSISLWVLVDDGQPLKPIRFSVEGTGQPMVRGAVNYEYDATYIGTVQDPFGYVWHVFRHYDEPEPTDEPLVTE